MMMKKKILQAVLVLKHSRYSWAKERAEKKDDSKDEDSSSFLRMIMD